MSFWGYVGGTLVRPGRTLRSLSADPKRRSQGFKAILFVGFLYAGTAAGLAAGGALITAPAFIPLSPVNYYFWEIFFAPPVLVAAWLMAAIFARTLRAGKSERGSFRSLLGTLGFALAIPQFLTWIAATSFAVLLHLGMPQAEFMDLSAEPGLPQTLFVGYHALAAAWTLLLVIAAVGVSLKLKWWKAMIVGPLTAALFLFVLIVFIR